MRKSGTWAIQGDGLNLQTSKAKNNWVGVLFFTLSSSFFPKLDPFNFPNQRKRARVFPAHHPVSNSGQPSSSTKVHKASRSPRSFVLTSASAWDPADCL